MICEKDKSDKLYYKLKKKKGYCLMLKTDIRFNTFVFSCFKNNVHILKWDFRILLYTTLETVDLVFAKRKIKFGFKH